MYQYISIDIETTGLSPENDQILSIAAVRDQADLSNGGPFFYGDVGKLDYLNLVIHHERISGQPFALSMNPDLLRQSANKDSGAVELDQAIAVLQDFIGDTLIIAGKNFASFDRQFLIRAGAKLPHRTLDVGPLYLVWGDERMPSTEVCLRRAGLTAERSHDALADARDVCRLIRHRMLHGIEGGVFGLRPTSVKSE